MKNLAVHESLVYMPQINDGTLYHYTTADSLFKILENLTLRCSSLQNLNDLYEFNVGYLDDLKAFHNLSKIKNNIRLLCFTENYKQNGIIYEGTNHPRMWAQYADNNRGACIVIDKEKFIQENAALLRDFFYTIEVVKYKQQGFMLSDVPDTGSDTAFKGKEYLKKHYRQLFFNKHIDWRDEREVRFLGLDTPEFLSIKESIKFISLGNRFCQDNQLLNKLAFTIAKSEILKIFYEQRMFLYSDPTRIGYKDYDAASIIKNASDIVSQALTFFKKEC